jgi:hypothetical protein
MNTSSSSISKNLMGLIFLQHDWGEGSYDASIVKKLVMYYKKKVENTLLLKEI